MAGRRAPYSTFSSTEVSRLLCSWKASQCSLVQVARSTRPSECRLHRDRCSQNLSVPIRTIFLSDRRTACRRRKGHRQPVSDTRSWDRNCFIIYSFLTSLTRRTEMPVPRYVSSEYFNTIPSKYMLHAFLSSLLLELEDQYQPML